MTANNEITPQQTEESYVSPFTYAYEVTGIKVKDEIVGNTTNQNAVVQTYWKLTGTDGDGNQATFNGATPFTSTTMPEGTLFVPFAELTEQVVINWINTVVVESPGYQKHIDTQLQKQIDDVITPVTDATLPWVT
jgi:hypothetical protein